MAKLNVPLEEPIMNQVKTAGGKNAPPSNRVPGLNLNTTRTAAEGDAPLATSTMNPERAFSEADAPEPLTVQHPNVDAAGLNAPVSYSPGAYPPGVTNTTNVFKSGPEDNTAPPVNPAPGHPGRVYTQDEVNAMLAQAQTQPATRPIDQQPYGTALEVPIRSDERYVTVKPNRTIAPYIGDRTWYLKKDEAVKVPQAVAQELGRAGVIYPFYNF